MQQFLVNTGAGTSHSSHLVLSMVVSPLWDRTPQQHQESQSFLHNLCVTILIVTSSGRAKQGKIVKETMGKELKMEGAEF